MIYLPGIIFHEISHYLMCLLLGAKVKKVKIGLRSGSVTHVKPRSVLKSLLIATAPGLFAIIFAIIMIFTDFTNCFEYLKFYFVYVILYASAPSKADTNFLENHSLLNKIIFFPMFILFRLLYYASRSKHEKTIYALGVICVILICRILLMMLLSNFFS